MFKLLMFFVILILVVVFCWCLVMIFIDNNKNIKKQELDNIIADLKIRISGIESGLIGNIEDAKLQLLVLEKKLKEAQELKNKFINN